MLSTAILTEPEGPEEGAVGAAVGTTVALGAAVAEAAGCVAVGAEVVVAAGCVSVAAAAGVLVGLAELEHAAAANNAIAPADSTRPFNKKRIGESPISAPP